MKPESKRMQKLKELGLIGCLNDSGITSETKIGPLPQWIKCSERMPDIGIKVLAYFPLEGSYGIHTAIYQPTNPINDWRLSTFQTTCDKPTHWMPLPEAPHD